MSRKNPYTQEQMTILEQNKYTHSVSKNRIVFTLEFKEFFVDQARNHNMTAPAILEAAGYDLSYFSRKNIDKIRYSILHEADSETGLKPPRGLSSEEKIKEFEAKDLAAQKTDATIKELQEHIVHLEKQIEFLKKISHIRDQK